MVDVTTEIIIDRPVAVVTDYTANPDNAPEWYVNIKSVEWKTPKPLTIGSKIGFTAHFLGRNLSYTYEVIEFIPSGFSKLFAPFMAAAMRRANQKDLQKLKQVLEQQSS